MVDTEYTPTAADVEAVARVLAAIESRKPGWGFSLDEAVAYRVEKWRRHTFEAEQLLEEMKPWLAQVRAEAKAEALEEAAKALPEIDRNGDLWDSDRMEYMKVDEWLLARAAAIRAQLEGTTDE